LQGKTGRRREFKLPRYEREPAVAEEPVSEVRRNPRAVASE